MVLGIISVHYSRNIYLKINCIFNTLVLPTMYITNDLVESLYFDFYTLTFCYATVIPLLIIFLTCTFVWPLNIIAVLGAGTEYHTLIDIYEEKNCYLYTYCLMYYYSTCSKNHGTKQMNKRNLQTLVYIATVKRSLLQLSQMLFLLQSTERFFFLILFLHPSYTNLLSLELEINFENENVCYNYLQHTHLWYSQNYMIIPYWKSSFFLRAKQWCFCMEVYIHFDSHIGVISTSSVSNCSPVRK